MQDLSQMILWILQNNRELAKSSPVTSPTAQTPSNYDTDSGYGEAARRISSAERQSIYVVDQPVDMSGLSISPSKQLAGNPLEYIEPYMYIPPDSRACYRLLVQEALRHDLRQGSPLTSNGTAAETTAPTLFSKSSIELMNEVGNRWRIPHSSRLVLFLDVVREMFQEREVDLETVDSAFAYIKEPVQDKRKIDSSLVLDRTRWTIRDFVLNQQILAAIHETLLRDLFEQLQHCYDTRPPEIGAIMTVLETRIYEDPFFSKTPEDLDRFSDQLHTALQVKARETYHAVFMKEIGQYEDRTEFFHVIQFGKAVTKLIERIRKRYNKTPQIMG